LGKSRNFIRHRNGYEDIWPVGQITGISSSSQSKADGQTTVGVANNASRIKPLPCIKQTDIARLERATQNCGSQGDDD
jgi:hypothetical protein